MSNISDKACVSPKAKVGNNVTIYPFAYIEDDVVIGDNCIIYPYVSIMNGTRLGKGNKVFQNTVLGAEPQDFNYRGDASQLIIGDRIIFSSGVIANPGARVGDAAMIQSGTRFSRDVPPFIVATDNPVRYGGVNSTVLRNYGVDEKVIAHIANAYRLVFHGQTSVFDAVNQVVDQVPDGPEIQNIVKFIRETKLGIISKL